jgi:hypothetical protein
VQHVFGDTIYISPSTVHLANGGVLRRRELDGRSAVVTLAPGATLMSPEFSSTKTIQLFLGVAAFAAVVSYILFQIAPT